MKLLLDTHIWLWLVIEPRRLGNRTLKTLRNLQNEIWISPISTLEALTLHHKRRVRLQGDLTEWVARATAGTKVALFTHEIALACRQFPSDYDPFDRILAATALVLDLTLVTADGKLLDLGNIRTLANSR